MSANFHAVVWIDHHEARVFRFNDAEVGRLVIHPDRPARRLDHKAQCIGSGKAPEDHDFLQRVADAVSGAGVILITGLADEKAELVEHMRHHSPALLQKIVTVEIVNHPSDGQIIHHTPPYSGSRMASHGGQHFSVKVPTSITIEAELSGVEEEDVSATPAMGC